MRCTFTSSRLIPFSVLHSDLWTCSERESTCCVTAGTYRGGERGEREEREEGGGGGGGGGEGGERGERGEGGESGRCYI